MINVVHFTSNLWYHIPVENGGNQLVSVAIGGDADDRVWWWRANSEDQCSGDKQLRLSLDEHFECRNSNP